MRLTQSLSTPMHWIPQPSLHSFVWAIIKRDWRRGAEKNAEQIEERQTDRLMKRRWVRYWELVREWFFFSIYMNVCLYMYMYRLLDAVGTSLPSHLSVTASHMLTFPLVHHEDGEWDYSHAGTALPRCWCCRVTIVRDRREHYDDREDIPRSRTFARHLWHIGSGIFTFCADKFGWERAF